MVKRSSGEKGCGGLVCIIRYQKDMMKSEKKEMNGKSKSRQQNDLYLLQVYYLNEV
jgi:hypothetical protein